MLLNDIAPDTLTNDGDSVQLKGRFCAWQGDVTKRCSVFPNLYLAMNTSRLLKKDQ